MATIVKFPTTAERDVLRVAHTINEGFANFARECITELDARLATVASAIRAVPEDALRSRLGEEHTRVLHQIDEIRERLTGKNVPAPSAE